MPNNNYNMKYKSRNNTREYNTYTEEYFAGADVTLTLGGKVLNNVSGLQYTIQEQQKPIYGYASRVFDDISVGNRIVVGTIKVPIINSGEITDVTQTTNGIAATPANTEPTWVNNTGVGDNIGAVPVIPLWEEVIFDEDKATEESSEGEEILEYSEDTKKVQNKLAYLNYQVDITGVVDTKTKEAIKLFQADVKMTATGELDKLTIDTIIGYEYAGTEIKYKTNVANEPVMSGPTLTAKILFTLKQGDIVWLMFDSNDEWLFVQSTNDVLTAVLGYVKKEDMVKV